MTTAGSLVNEMEIERIRDELSTRRAELVGELERLTEPPEEGASVGFGKRIGDGTTEAVERLATTATARSLAGSIADIDRALQSIAAGTYGSCEACGKRIANPRLEALPATTRCVSCAGLTETLT
jgi:DnaK suppressor protein